MPAVIEKLPILFFNRGQFYWVKDKQNKIADRIEFSARTIEEQVRNRNLSPNETVTGILMFYLKDRNKYVGKKETKLKLIFFDSLKNKDEYIIDTTVKKQPKKERLQWIGAFNYTIKEVGVDLKKFQIINDY